MAHVTIYTKPYCPYCIRAVSLLEKKGVAFTEVEAAFDPEKRQEMMQRAGGRATFPQIFVGERHIGGCDDMLALEREGKLDPLLQQAA
ncbi:glutaredoxin 3 [Phenylobacterium sp.]|uniref:glutaredoxin 3 n=1 Tax=Phenylobacterium sp. TaxID=1871053 RepID=UPI002DE70179|nr:glutaredoxin 3 [Phenylobacterium sp.]